MLNTAAVLDRLDHVLALARRAGADTADAIYRSEASTSVAVRLGQLEDVGRSEGEEIGIRLFVGQRSAQVAVSDLSASALAEAVERARAMAALAPEDPYAGLAPAEMLARGPFADFDLHDPAVLALDAEQLRAMALEAEDAARAIPGISNSEGGSASAGTSLIALATTGGFAGAAVGTSVSVSAVVVAGETGGRRQRDHAWAQARHLADLEPAAQVGDRAGRRTVARLDPRPAPTGRMPVLFDSRVSASLLAHLTAAISGSAIARRTSFLHDWGDRPLFAPGIRVRDDPHRLRGLRSRAFDAEGLPTAARDIIADGRLTGWLLDSASGRQLGLPPTGHATRGTSGPPGVAPSNLWLEAGEQTVEALMSDIRGGLYVTELIGMGVNLLTGDYSRGAAGFRIRGGQLAEPVAEATVAGNLVEMFATLVPADDLAFRHAIDAPTVRIDGLTVAGQG